MRRQSAAHVANAARKLPQKRSVKSKAKSAWLKKVRKTSTKAKAFVGRGSHTMCMAQFEGCRRGQAKVARPEIKDILVAQYGQATALCKYCQTVVQERLKK